MEQPVRLTELKPKWIHARMFTFLCPHCQKVFLTCKDIVMPMSEQLMAFEDAFGPEWNLVVVPCKEDCSWSIRGQFENMTVTPSIDASNSGHWHGHITNGAVLATGNSKCL